MIRTGHYALVPEPLVVSPSLAQRLNLLALTKPDTVRRHAYVSAVLGVWTAIGTVSSLVLQNWVVAAITGATFTLSTFMWWTSRRALRRIPETQRWLDDLSR